MKKFNFKPYLGLVVVAYYILTFTMMVTFFCYVIISEKLHEQIHIKEIELQYALESQNDTASCKIQEELNMLKMNDNIYMAEGLKYLLISSILIALIIADIKVYSKMKGKKCWYTALHENIQCLIFTQG